MIVPSKIPHSQGKRIGRSSLSLHKFKELFRYLRITASTDVDPVVLPLLPLLLPSLSSAIVRGPGELAVATIGVAHGGSAIRNRARMFSQSLSLSSSSPVVEASAKPILNVDLSVNLAWKNKQTTLFKRLVITKLCVMLLVEGILIFAEVMEEIIAQGIF